jgi:multidrug efflux pump subunit AcrA (membrane-fusion protein)
MHRKTLAILLAVLMIAGLTVGGALVFAQERADATQAEAADAVAQEAAAASVESAPRAVIAKGAVMPVQRAMLSMASGGIVAEAPVREGEQVKAGDLILRLRNERQQAALAEAEAGLAAAQAQLETLKAGARSEEIAAAQAGLEAAQARVARLQEGGREGDVAAARANVVAAQAALARLNQGADENTKIAAQADLANAEAALRNAQAAYDRVKDQPNVGMLPQSLQLEQASNAYSAAKARWDEVNAAPKADRVAQANAGVKQAQAELDRLLDPATAASLAEAEAAVRQAQAQVDLLKSGARQQEIAAAEAAVAQAEAGVRQAHAALNDTELRAPFAGLLAVLAPRMGEQVAPGAPVAEIGDVSGWQVETDDLSELDVVRVQGGAEVNLTFDAIPGLELRGVVERVQPKGEKKLGDMTYTAIIRIPEGDPRLLWNMTAIATVP